MAGDVLSDTTRLMRVIGALSSISEDIDASGRLLRPEVANSQTVLDLILIEITETVLRRVLIFQDDNGQSLALEVAERRIIQILTLPDGACAQPEGEPITHRTLTSDDAPAVMSLLQAFSDKARQIRVVSHLPDDPHDGALDGVSCHDLLQFVQDPQPATKIEPRIISAIEASKKHARALVVTNGGQVAIRWGEEAACQALARIQSVATVAAQEHSIRLWYLGDDAIIMGQKASMFVWVKGQADQVEDVFQAWKTALLD